MDSPDISTCLVLVILLLFSAFFSAAETAFSSVNLLRIRNMAEDGSHRAKTALHLSGNFDKLLATILIGNNVVNIATSALMTVVATQLFGAKGVAIATGVATLLVLTFGEILPKSFAKENSEQLVLLIAPFMNLLCVLLTPLSFFFIHLRGIFSRGGEGQKTPTITEQELMYMLGTIQEEGVLEAQEKDLVQSALEFDETTVQEVITPRVNMVALDIEDTHKEILDTVLSERYSRLPVYEGTIDNIVGMVHSREILERLIKGKEVSLKDMMSEMTFVHRTMKISNLLGQFQREKNHMAVVIDDYGGTLGLVTMEDLLEELVGDIWDEDDEVITECTHLGDNVYQVSGDMNIEEFFDTIGYAPKDFESDYNTMNGWALEQLEHIPHVGESFEYHMLTVTVEEMDDQRITRLRVQKNIVQPLED